MSKSHFERMLQLAEEIFDTKSDPNQLDVDENVINHLQEIHPATMSEYDDGKGPAVWILLIPTTEKLMIEFLNDTISEKELYHATPLNIDYDCIYLCSAMVLEEYRGKGIAQKLTINAIESIRKDHSVKYLFTWPFSKQGLSLANKIAKLSQLPLKVKE
jgi:predicted GNAT family acetyltransferase